MMRNTTMLKTLAALGATALLAGCQSVDYNPFERSEDKAPIVQAEPGSGGTAMPEQASTPVSAAPAISYQVPMGGPNTFSLSVSSCLDGCEIVNVMIDPDNYWQRTSPEGTTKGHGRARLYDDVANAFQAQGFYAFQGQLDILPGNQQTCSEYEPGGQVFFLSMSRNSGQRIVNYDTGCAGSASADAAADGINTVVGITDYMDVVSGNAPVEP